MKKFKKIKLLLTALYIGMPISVVLNNAQESNAMLKAGSVASKISSSFKKPPLPPKPTNVPKISPKMAAKVNRTTSLPTTTPKPNGISKRVSSFSDKHLSKKVESLNLTTKTNKKLNLNPEFKNKLNSIFAEGKPTSVGKKQTNSVNKIAANNPEKQKLQSLLGGSSTISTPHTTTNKVFENKSPNIPDAPPLPSINTPKPNIPDAPPLPTSKDHLKPLKQPSSILQTKAPEKKMLSKPASPQTQLQNNLMDELSKKLQQRNK